MSDELSAMDAEVLGQYFRVPYQVLQVTPVDAMRDVLLAERAVIEAAEELVEYRNQGNRIGIGILIDHAQSNLESAVAKLREVRGK